METSFAGCATPRNGVLSGLYMGVDMGYVRLDQAAERRIGAGPGLAIQLRFGVEFWDHINAGIGFGGLLLKDRDPISEMVVDCTTVEGTVVTCDDEPHSQRSNVQAGFLWIDVGAQQRIRPWLSNSFTLGAAIGYQFGSAFSRGVDCQGCDRIDLDATATGAYLAPFLRVTFGEMGYVAAALRWALYVSGDVASVATLGFEFGVP